MQRFHVVFISLHIHRELAPHRSPAFSKVSSAMAVKSNAQEGDTPRQNTANIFIHHSEAVWENRDTYGPPGFTGIFINYYAALCAAFAAIGGLIFGYDQGVVSVILVMPQFLSRFTRVSDSASGAGFWKGLLTAMVRTFPRPSFLFGTDINF